MQTFVTLSLAHLLDMIAVMMVVRHTIGEVFHRLAWSRLMAVVTKVERESEIGRSNHDPKKNVQI